MVILGDILFSRVARSNIHALTKLGANVTLVDGLISDCAKIVMERKDKEGWFDVSTLKEPYRIEGKKTMGYELAEQLGWELPDAIFYPTGGGTGLIGMWKAFEELDALGWLNSPHKPRMYAVQSTGCAPIVRAFESGERFAAPFPNAHTVASGIRVPAGQERSTRWPMPIKQSSPTAMLSGDKLAGRLW